MIFVKKDGESAVDYVMRLADERKVNRDITWQGIADSLLVQFGIDRSEAWVRKLVKDQLGLTTTDEEMLESLVEAKAGLDSTILELQKERIKLSDERTQNRAYIRKMSREETLKEIALLTAQEMSSKKLLKPVTTELKAKAIEREAILCIGDWHYGMDFKNPWNEYSPEICRNRVTQLRDETIKYLKKNKCSKLHLVNLQDLIAGRIHLGLRLESRFDVITQTMEISEILAEFITDLSKVCEVNYYDSLDNHSRLEPSKSDAQDLETLCRMIPWYLKERLKKNKRVTICENEYGHDLVTFESLGHKIIASHGDRDTKGRALNLAGMTKEFYDLILTAHLHHFWADSCNNMAMIGNGSLMGTDTFAKNLRLNSDPSQTLIIVSPENAREAIHIIKLD